MLFSVICKNTKCANKNVEYLIPNQEDLVLCGGCKTFITPLNTGNKAPIYLPYTPAPIEEAK